MSEMIRNRVTKEFMDIVQIDSLSLREEKMLQYLDSRLKNLPVEKTLLPYSLPQTGSKSANLIVRLPATDPARPGLFFDAHLDTVTPGEGIKPVLENGIVRSDGTTILGSDDKAGVAAMIIALEELCSKPFPHGDLFFVFSTAEEIGLTGVRHMDFSKLKARYGFILDSHGSVGGIITAAPEHYQYSITVTGKASHAGIAPEHGKNAIQTAAKIAAILPQGRVNKDTVTNIGMIEGGEARNIVAAHCVITGEFRTHRMEDCTMMAKRITEAARRFEKEAVNIDVHFEKMYSGFNYPAESPIIQLTEKAVTALGLKPRLERTGGGSNTNIYNEHGIASVTIAVGMTNVHSNDEYVETEDLMNLTRLIIKLAELAA